MKTLHDNFGNTAKITKKNIYPFRGSQTKEEAYILTVTADYEENLVYFVSVYESEREVMKKLKEFSCGTFK